MYINIQPADHRELDLPLERPLPEERFDGDFLEGAPDSLRDLPEELPSDDALRDEEAFAVVILRLRVLPVLDD